MSNYSDNHNWNAYDRTIGSVASAADQVWEAHAAQLSDIVNRAFQDFPVTSIHRREAYGHAIGKVNNAMKAFTLLSEREKAKLLQIYSLAIEADMEDDQEAVQQSFGEYMHVYSCAIERAGEGL